MQKLIITAALTGNVPTKKMNPHLPVTPDEIAGDVKRCSEAGASLFHVHARDADAQPTLDIACFKAILNRIRETAPDPVIQLSTGGRAGKGWEDRVGPIRLYPEMGSFTTGSTNLPGMVYENSPRFIEYLAGVFKETGVKPEIEVFEAGMINNALYLQKKGLLTPPLHFDFVLGAPGALPGTVRNLVFLSDSIPENATWSVAGIAGSEIPMAVAAILMGGHVRVGLEDNLYMPDGGLASNVKLVENVVRIAREIGREIATPKEARRILSLGTARTHVSEPAKNRP